MTLCAGTDAMSDDWGTPDWAHDEMVAELDAARERIAELEVALAIVEATREGQEVRAEAAEARERKLVDALRAAKGYLLNIVIDMDTGTRRSTTAATASGGVNMVDLALAPYDTPAAPEMPADCHPQGE